MRGDGDADLVGHFEPAAAFERFLGEKDVHMPFEGKALLVGQQLYIRHVAIDEGTKLRRKRFFAELLATCGGEEEVEHVGSLGPKRGADRID